MVLINIMILVLLLFAVLGFFSLHWSSKLRKLTDDDLLVPRNK
jgi:hypothetical protein